MSKFGIVFRGEPQKYKLKKVPMIQSDSFDLPFEKTLFVEGVKIPVDLLPAGWNFLNRWDLAVPLWKYGQTAADVGTPVERALTEKIVRDLRVLLHSYELLFVRRNEAGRAFMAAWEEEIRRVEVSPPPAPPLGGSVDKRLAFLRAYYQVKPIMCVLPTSWLAEIRQGSDNLRQTARSARRHSNTRVPLVTIELEGGRRVKVPRGQEEKARQQFATAGKGRHAREAEMKKKGKLIKVELQPGRMVKMYEADAIEQGLIPGAKKMEPAGNKMRAAEGDKASQRESLPPAGGDEVTAGGEEETAAADDFTTIEGVGKATARALNVFHIKTFEELRAAPDLSFLSGPAQAAIERWRETDG